MARFDFHNATELCDRRLRSMFDAGIDGWSVGSLSVRVRYSRGADFSGTCFYNDGRVFINIGRHLVFPYRMTTYVARARTVGRRWYKPPYTIELIDGEGVALFVFLHELYHLLVSRSRRNRRQKESMCDRFATRFIVDRYGGVVRDDRGRPAPRGDWDFQDLDAFVDRARDRRVRRTAVEARRGQRLLFPA